MAHVSTKGWCIRVRGQVQGVGFRPFVWQLAQKHAAKGHVLNDPNGVLIYAVVSSVDAFVSELKQTAPPLSRVDDVVLKEYQFDAVPDGFEIVRSAGSGSNTGVTPDAATCADCLEDLRGSDPRRHGYAFTNCTHCGPRFTILHGLPYDRAKTTMAEFAMCSACAKEYQDPADRRFHAQPVACADCGPQLSFEHTRLNTTTDPISAAARSLEDGDILAIKGLGGFHLCCDATNAKAIKTLRARKQRPTKPLALMAREKHLNQFAKLDHLTVTHLQSPAAPIVLLPKADNLPDELAPGQRKLGWMLPYTPLHHLLLDAVDRPLVMTSGNLSGEPQVIGNDEARKKLADLVDGYLLHNRDIARRLDDSVEQVTPHGPMVLRRARGRVPETLALPEGFEKTPEVLATGGHLKAAICLIKNGQALLSHHLGDLDDALTWDEFLKADADYAALFDHKPEIVACDAHRGYLSSQHAQNRAAGLQLLEVQHHHAHLAACLAENDWPLEGGAVAGIILDGLGLGTDGTIWGGELLLGDYMGFERIAHLQPAPLVGGDLAQREPWRNAVMRLDQSGLTTEADARFGHHPLALIRQAADAGVNSVMSSSVGRLFDAVAAFLGLCDGTQSYEGEAAMALEAIASGGFDNPYPFGDDLTVAPLFHAMSRDLEDGVSLGEISGRFHAGLASAFVEPARDLVRSGQASAIALSGGCFQNAVLLDQVMTRLHDVTVFHHTKVPANDGSLALGQAVIAAASAVFQR